MQTRLDIPTETTWGVCRRNDPVCSQRKKKTHKIIWTPTGKVFAVCENCAEAIVKRSTRTGGEWKHV